MKLYNGTGPTALGLFLFLKFKSTRMKYYAGIGSRETPPEFEAMMQNLASKLEDMNYILRSGGAQGADTFFEQGVKDPKNKEIYLPWKNFNNNKSPYFKVSKEAIQLAKKYHPLGEELKYPSTLFMCRNCYQVLGLDLKTPVEFIVCWTHAGLDSGGTGQALRIAKDLNIPVYNLAKDTLVIL